MQLSKYLIYSDLYNLVCVSNDYHKKYIKYINEYIEKRNKYLKYILSIVIGNSLEYIYLHPVKLNLVYKQFSYDISEEDCNNASDVIDYDINLEDIEKYNIKTFNWNTIIFKQTELEIYTDLNGNDDIRGGGCGNLNIPVEDFTYSIKNEKGITMKDITECVYRLKGSKYDLWYELFGAIEIKEISENKIKCKISFDYGS